MPSLQHSSRCTICQHADTAEIERAWLDYEHLDDIAQRHSVTRSALKRHAKACGLANQRSENTLAALDIITEKGLAAIANETLKVNQALLAASMQLAAKIRGQLVADKENIGAMLEGLTDAELDYWAKTGTVPKPGDIDEQDGPGDDPQ